MTTIKQIKFIIYQVLSTNKSLSCYLFGSYAKGKQNENSDVDILIIVDKEQYEYKKITNIKEQIRNEFEKINIYSEPIFGYIQNINEDKSVLFREYIGYGKLLFGDDLSTVILQETPQEQKQIEGHAMRHTLREDCIPRDLMWPRTPLDSVEVEAFDLWRSLWASETLDCLRANQTHIRGIPGCTTLGRICRISSELGSQASPGLVSIGMGDRLVWTAI